MAGWSALGRSSLLKRKAQIADSFGVFWIAIGLAAVVIGFAVGRFALPILLLLGFVIWDAARHHPQVGDGEDIVGIAIVALGIFVVGGTTVGVVARHAARWARRASSSGHPS